MSRKVHTILLGIYNQIYSLMDIMIEFLVLDSIRSQVSQVKRSCKLK
jgi:hypothetical protein